MPRRHLSPNFKVRVVGYPTYLPKPVAFCARCRSMVYEPLEEMTCGQRYTGCPFSKFVIETIYDRPYVANEFEDEPCSEEF